MTLIVNICCHGLIQRKSSGNTRPRSRKHSSTRRNESLLLTSMYTQIPHHLLLLWLLQWCFAMSLDPISCIGIEAALLYWKYQFYSYHQQRLITFIVIVLLYVVSNSFRHRIKLTFFVLPANSRQDTKTPTQQILELFNNLQDRIFFFLPTLDWSVLCDFNLHLISILCL